MALGKPVIATGYSGNRHFMTPENSYLVDWVKAPISPGCDPYPASATWAEPDIDHAARLMREVFERPADAAARARRGKDDIVTRHSVANAAAAVTARVREIRRAREGRLLVPEVVVPKEIPMSLRAAPPPASSIAEPIESLMPHLESVAAPRAGAGSGALGGLRLSAQRLLFRVLRPYWFQQYQFAKFVIAGFGRVATSMRYEQQQREALDARVRELTRELVSCKREIYHLERTVVDLDGRQRHDGTSGGR
jgi:hypothetical protein